jgi:hypothetical protein
MTAATLRVDGVPDALSRQRQDACSPHERSDMRDRPPDVASGRAFARPLAHPGYGCCLFSYAIALPRAGQGTAAFMAALRDAFVQFAS